MSLQRNLIRDKLSYKRNKDRVWKYKNFRVFIASFPLVMLTHKFCFSSTPLGETYKKHKYLIFKARSLKFECFFLLTRFSEQTYLQAQISTICLRKILEKFERNKSKNLKNIA